MPSMVVGLGNPGARYRQTRHNAGFWVVEALLGAVGGAPLRLQLQAQIGRQRHGAKDVLWCMPQTFMNDSGRAVGALARYYRVEPSDILVVHDELDFPVGQVRLKQGGGHGGHNGLRSIIEHLGADFGRLRLGIGRPPAGMAGADYVLAAPDATQREQLALAVQAAGDAVQAVLTLGMRRAMNRINAMGSCQGPKPAP